MKSRDFRLCAFWFVNVSPNMLQEAPRNAAGVDFASLVKEIQHSVCLPSCFFNEAMLRSMCDSTYVVDIVDVLKTIQKHVSKIIGVTTQAATTKNHPHARKFTKHTHNTTCNLAMTKETITNNQVVTCTRDVTENAINNFQNRCNNGSTKNKKHNPNQEMQTELDQNHFGHASQKCRCSAAFMFGLPCTVKDFFKHAKHR